MRSRVLVGVPLGTRRGNSIVCVGLKTLTTFYLPSFVTASFEGAVGSVKARFLFRILNLKKNVL